jgi:hypothetical protein
VTTHLCIETPEEYKAQFGTMSVQGAALLATQQHGFPKALEFAERDPIDSYSASLEPCGERTWPCTSLLSLNIHFPLGAESLFLTRAGRRRVYTTCEELDGRPSSPSV